MSRSIERLSTGIEGLDAVLHGGLIAGRSYMLDGPPGAGKTVFGLEFLDAAGPDEPALFVNLEEDPDDLRTNAETLGFDVDAVELLDLSPGPEAFSEEGTYDVFHPSEVEGEPLVGTIVERVREVDPDRVVVDPITQLHYLTSGEYQFRKQAVGLMRFLTGGGATVLYTVQDTGRLPTEDLEYIGDGTIHLDASPAGRVLRVPKFRGSATLSGEHAFRIDADGVAVFPELAPGDHGRSFEPESVPSGIPEIDELLHGGLERGTVSVLSGPTGVGKTTLGTQFMKEAAGRGERSVVYLFEETRGTFLTRSTALNIPVDRMLERGTLRIEEVDALDMSPQEFAGTVRDEVESNDTSIVMLDGIAGYGLTLQGRESDTVRRLHSLGRYLKNVGVTSVFVDETSNVTGEFRATDRNLSYLADNIVFLRHLEIQGELRKAIGVLKKRTSDFERTLREFEMTEHGLKVGEPLTDLQGVLTGTPTVVEHGRPATDRSDRQSDE
jgi:circadian clock protein KaiC